MNTNKPASLTSQINKFNGVRNRIGNYRWFIAFLLFAATTINYIDRQIFGLLKPELEKIFAWTETDYSRIVMAFTACYAIGQLVYGKIIDRIGTKLSYTISVLSLIHI